MILFVNACVREESRTKRLADDLLVRLGEPAEELRLSDVVFPVVDEAFLRKRNLLIADEAFDDPLFAMARQFAAADHNLSFGDNYYYTKYGRNLVQQTFLDCGIDILTQAVPECIDHIAVSKGFAGETVTVTECNMDKSLSDHKGIVVEIS